MSHFQPGAAFLPSPTERSRMRDPDIPTQRLVTLPDGVRVSLDDAVQGAVRLHQAGRVRRALVVYDLILAADPQQAEILNLKGVALHQTGDSGSAIASIRQALASGAAPAGCYNNLAKVYSDTRAFESAVEACRQALALHPGLAEARYLLGSAWLALDRLDEADACIAGLLQDRPDFVAAYAVLVEIHCRQGRAEVALAQCRAALERLPGRRELVCAVGFALRHLGRTRELVAHYQDALARDPDFPEAASNLANACADLGRLREAAEQYARALTLAPHYADSHSSLLMLSNYLPGLSPDEIAARHFEYARRHETPLIPLRRPHGNVPDPERRLRIGYVSSDFRIHAVACFIEPVLRCHDRSRFEVYCYANSLTEDDMTRRLQGLADGWRNIVRLSDDEVADLIRRDAIDILIDLNGHTGGNRLLVFARKPAPVQVTWIGYPNTTGLAAIDYRLTDARVDPPGHGEQRHSEALVRLPGAFSCYEPPGFEAGIGPLPRDGNGYVTFGSFNNLSKISDEVIALWARILARLPDARLIIKTGALDDSDRAEEVRAAFLAQADVASRLELIGHSAGAEAHFDHYNRIDIALDPFPYNGTTTTCDALWMGVPVVVLEGDSHVSRVGVSQLGHLGLAELVARDAGGTSTWPANWPATRNVCGRCVPGCGTACVAPR